MCKLDNIFFVNCLQLASLYFKDSLVFWPKWIVGHTGWVVQRNWQQTLALLESITVFHVLCAATVAYEYCGLAHWPLILYTMTGVLQNNTGYGSVYLYYILSSWLYPVVHVNSSKLQGVMLSYLHFVVVVQYLLAMSQKLLYLVSLLWAIDNAAVF